MDDILYVFLIYLRTLNYNLKWCQTVTLGLHITVLHCNCHCSAIVNEYCILQQLSVKNISLLSFYDNWIYCINLLLNLSLWNYVVLNHTTIFLMLTLRSMCLGSRSTPTFKGFFPRPCHTLPSSFLKQIIFTCVPMSCDTTTEVGKSLCLVHSWYDIYCLLSYFMHFTFYAQVLLW